MRESNKHELNVCKVGSKAMKVEKDKILDIRTYPCKLNIGDEQEIVLVEDDDGPFNMKPHVRRKKLRFIYCGNKDCREDKEEIDQKFERKTIYCERSLQQRQVSQARSRL